MVGCFCGEIFHELAYPNFLRGKNFTNHQEHLVVNAFSKYFEGKIFTNGNCFVKFVPSLEKPAIINNYGICMHSYIAMYVASYLHYSV